MIMHSTNQWKQIRKAIKTQEHFFLGFNTTQKNVYANYKNSYRL